MNQWTEWRRKMCVKSTNGLPRMGNGFVWTVSVVDGSIRCEAVGDIALALELGGWMYAWPMLHKYVDDAEILFTNFEICRRHCHRRRRCYCHRCRLSLLSLTRILFLSHLKMGMCMCVIACNVSAFWRNFNSVTLSACYLLLLLRFFALTQLSIYLPLNV